MSRSTVKQLKASFYDGLYFDESKAVTHVDASGSMTCVDISTSADFMTCECELSIEGEREEVIEQLEAIISTSQSALKFPKARPV